MYVLDYFGFLNDFFVDKMKEGFTPKQQELKELKEKILKLKEDGLSNRAIAKQINCSEGKVRLLLKK